jgi:large subunit ribosomal protein L29e
LLDLFRIRGVLLPRKSNPPLPLIRPSDCLFVLVEGSKEFEMAKSKNHTAHNQSYKAHKNGIKKPKRHRQTSTKGVKKSAPAVTLPFLPVALSRSCAGSLWWNRVA